MRLCITLWEREEGGLLSCHKDIDPIISDVHWFEAERAIRAWSARLHFDGGSTVVRQRLPFQQCHRIQLVRQDGRSPSGTVGVVG